MSTDVLRPAAAPQTGTLDRLRAALQGTLLQPEDAGYAEARLLWNGMIDRRPAAIVACSSTADVVETVRYAREHGLPLAVRGGGHNVAGHAVVDDGLVIDLGGLREVKVDAEQRTATAQGGATIGDLDRATQAHALATPMGVVSATGIAGLTLGGGYGWLRSKYGLSCDNLIRAQVVLWDGQVVTAGETEHPDLLWALRGGGGNFGVVTEFVYRLYPVGPDVAMVFAFQDGRGPRMRQAIEHFLEFSRQAPDDISLLGAVGKIPPSIEHFPADLHNVPFFLFGAMYAGDPARGEELLRPLRDYGSALVDSSGVMPYLSVQQLFDADYPNGMRYYWKSLNLDSLEGEALDLFIEHALRQPSPFSTTDIWPNNGAARRFGPEHAALHGRGAACLINPEANWVDAADDAANVQWVRDFVAAMRPWSDGGRYLNFAGFYEEGDALVRDAFGPQYARLAQVKARYDPHNVFRLNANIQPAPGVQ